MDGYKNIDEKKISDSFEKSFLGRSLEKQIELCNNNEFTSIFKRLLPDKQPILEAGCGSGRWVAWFIKNNWKAVGIDWSEKLIERAKNEIPDAEFYTADIRNTSFKNEEFGSIVSLGAIEHTLEGPLASLKEHNRILSKDGILILSIPYGSILRKIVFPFNRMIIRLKCNNFLRKIIGKNPITGEKYRDIKKITNRKWFPLISAINAQWQFYEYRFSKSQIEGFLAETNFNISEVLYLFPDQGLLHTFGRIVGEFNYDTGKVKLNLIGIVLNSLISRKLSAHHICFIAKKNK